MIAEAHELGLRILLDIVPNHLSDQHAWFQEALAAGPGSRERARFIFRDGRGPDGAQPPNDWRSNFGGAGMDPGHRGRRHARASGTCTCSPPSSPTSTGPTPRCARSSTRRCGSGSTWASTDSGSTSPTAWPRRRASRTSARPRGRRSAQTRSTTRTGIATTFTRSTGRGVRWPTPTTTRACSSPRPGCTTPSAWRCTSATTSCTPRSTSTSCWRPGSPSRCATRSSRHSRPTKAVGAPPTWVLSNHDTVREVSRYARPQGVRELRHLDDLLELPADFELGVKRARAAALLMLALPGGAYVYQGEELGSPRSRTCPTRCSRIPAWEQSRLYAARPRRLPGADPVVRSRAAVRLQPRRRERAAVAAAAALVARRSRSRRRPATSARCSSSTAARYASATSIRRSETGRCGGSTRRKVCSLSPATPGSCAWSTCRPTARRDPGGAELLLSSGAARGRRRCPGRYDRVVHDAGVSVGFGTWRNP